MDPRWSRREHPVEEHRSSRSRSIIGMQLVANNSKTKATFNCNKCEFVCLLAHKEELRVKQVNEWRKREKEEPRKGSKKLCSPR